VAPGRRYRALALAILAAAVAVTIIAIVSPSAAAIAGGIAVLAAGGGSAAAAHRARMNAPAPLLAMKPTVERLELTERLSVAVTLDDRGQYASVPSEVDGTIEALLVFGPADQARFRRSARQGARSADRDTRFTAGRLVLKGRGAIATAGRPVTPILPLDGNTAEFPVFRETDALSSSRWPCSLSYALTEAPDLNSGPIWITPSVQPGSDRRSLELELQWVKLGPENALLSMEMVDFFELCYPVEWGKVEQASRDGTVVVSHARLDAEGRPGSKIRWSQILLDKEHDNERRITLVVRFQNRIDLSDQISGSVEVVMKGALSGIGDIEHYGSQGELRERPNGARVRTRIASRFELSLASIRYQAELVFPPHRAKNNGNSQFTASFNVVPNAETVIELTNAMSEHGYYVKRVIENTPRSGNNADVVQRYWDIAGRHYYGVWPLDFHVILTGEELHRGEIRPDSGVTHVRIIVRGSYSNPSMEERIEQLWKDLNQLARDAVGRLGQSATANGHVNSDGPLPASGGAGLARSAPANPVLQVYLRKLIESWVSGRISDTEFWETRRRAEEDCGLRPGPGAADAGPGGTR